MMNKNDVIDILIKNSKEIIFYNNLCYIDLNNKLSHQSKKVIISLKKLYLKEKIHLNFNVLFYDLFDYLCKKYSENKVIEILISNNLDIIKIEKNNKIKYFQLNLEINNNQELKKEKNILKFQNNKEKNEYINNQDIKKYKNNINISISCKKNNKNNRLNIFFIFFIINKNIKTYFKGVYKCH